MTAVQIGWDLSEDEWGQLHQAVRANPRFGAILNVILPGVMLRFAKASQDYGDAAEELGPKAQFVDINRKIRKLRRSMWDDLPLVGEQTNEILADLIAHCLLALDLLARDE